MSLGQLASGSLWVRGGMAARQSDTESGAGRRADHAQRCGDGSIPIDDARGGLGCDRCEARVWKEGSPGHREV